ETSFDGGRVEISTDAGKTWRPLRPLPDLVQGLPDGYPSMALLGTSPLLDGQPAQEAAAYTGRSADLPGATGGFATASFDLAQDPTLHARGPIDAFHQDGFAVAPAARPLAASDGPRFTDPSWQLQEKDALARQRYWWVDNATYGIDAHPGRQLWWSGSAGDEGARGVDNALRSGLIPVTAARPGDALRLTWWDWRAGAGDGDPTLRSGTGGDFTVRVLDGDTATVLAARVVATEPSGWTERSADLTAFVGKSVEIEFAYHSVLAAGDKRARLQDNLGWFVDGMRLESLQRLPGQGLGNPVLACSDPCDANGWTARAPTLAGSPAWTRAVPGDAARPGGWHVEAQEVPGKGQVATWRFSGPGAQGYPNGADSRLVTPVVDLAGLGSSAVRLTFDQQVGLESRRVCAGFGTSDCEGSFLSALDGGAVEVQVYNATTDSFGPWQQVGARFRSFPDALLFESLQPPLVNPETGHECASAASETGCRLRQPDRLSNLKQGPVANRDLLAGTGYTAIEERGHAARGILTGTVFSVDERAIPVGHGTSFEAHNALVRKQWTGLVGLPHTYTDGWTPYPVSYVFSGQGAGWQAVDWDIGPLAGQRVRFGFHVATNPSLTAPAADGHPYHGWSVANVAILGDLFQGKAAQVRLHLATDGSVERGQWSVDDVAVSGQRHASQVVVLPDSPLAVRALPDAPVTLAGHVANLGLAAQDGLAIAVRATGPGGVVLPVGLTGGALRPADPASRPAGLDGWSLFTVPGSSLTLYAAGVAGGNATQGFEIHLAAPAGEASVRVLALQARNRTAPGASGPVPVYEALRNDGGRDGAQVWSVVGEDTVHLVAVPPRAGSSDLLPTSRQGTAYTVQGQVLNDGTREARADVQWTFRQVFSKGSAAQPNTREDLGPILKDTLIHLGYVQPGASAPSQATFSPPAHGLYRAQADYYLEGVQDAVATVRTEFLDGLPSQHYAADFSTGMQNWTAQATEPSEIRFRQVGAALVWGTDDGQEAPDGYCSFAPGCNRQAGASNAPPVVGLEGIVGSPRIDLRRVPAGQATVTLTHQGSFTEGDGFQLEAVPYYLLGAAWTPAFTCSGAPGTPMGFVVPPIAPTATTLAYSLPSERLGGNQYAPTRTHPLNPSTAGGKVPILGGTTPLHTDSFDLGAVLKSTCDGTSARLVNYTVELRLHAGTRPGVDYTNGVVRTIERTGGTGLQATALSVSSAGATAFPAAQSYPVQAGAAKSFTFLLRNTGQAADAFTLGFEAAAFRPEWVRFPVPVVALAAGEARLVTFTVDVPGDTPLGAATYPGLVLARSVASPGIVATLRAALVVDPIRLPDLVAGPLSTDPAGGAFQTGTSGFVFSTIRNLGTLGALPAQVRLLASPADDPDAAPTVVETRPLPALCPALDCGDGGQATLQFEWVPPSTPGDVVLTVAIESSGAELSLANNRAALRVTVQPQTVPDVAVTSLVVEGVGKDGYAESGTLLVMRANVTNLGFAPASGVRVRMLSNASELLQQTIPALAPGQTVAVTAYKVASDGAFVLKAFAFPPANDPRTDNQELRRAVRVRTHGLSLGVGNLTVAPGEAATALLQVRNGGNGIERVLLSNGTAAGWGFAFTPNPVLVAPHSQTVVVVTVQAPQNASGLHRLQVLAAPAARPALQSTASLNVTVETLDGSPLLTATSVAAAPGRVAVPVKITSRTNVTQALTIGLGSPAWAAAPVRVALPAGGAKSTTLWVEVPPSAAVGAHPLALRVTDAANRTVAEAATVLTVQPSPAVHAAWQGGSRGLSGDPTLRRVELKLGLNNTGNVPEQVTLAPRDLAPGLAALAPPLVEALAPGESRTVPILLDVSGDAPASLYGLVEVWAAHLDANGTHEPRLAAALPLPAFLDAADLHIKRLDILPRGVAHAGDVLRVTATVENQGSQAAPATRLDAYVNGDLLAAIDVPALAPGAQATLTLNASFASAGTYLLVLKSDGAGIVQEMEKDNNAVSQAVTLDPPALLSPEYLHEKAPAAGLAFALLLLLVAAFVRRRRDA
ncbi:MAG: hypothetical protein QOG31_109, partial [Thermoplasmata archaeon]|nr:hypothetical protein [Thermoplasmata archaeon]